MNKSSNKYLKKSISWKPHLVNNLFFNTSCPMISFFFIIAN